MRMFNVHALTLANHAAILAVSRHDSSQNMYLLVAINVEKTDFIKTANFTVLRFTAYTRTLIFFSATKRIIGFFSVKALIFFFEFEYYTK